MSVAAFFSPRTTVLAVLLLLQASVLCHTAAAAGDDADSSSSTGSSPSSSSSVSPSHSRLFYAVLNAAINLSIVFGCFLVDYCLPQAVLVKAVEKLYGFQPVMETRRRRRKHEVGPGPNMANGGMESHEKVNEEEKSLLKNGTHAILPSEAAVPSFSSSTSSPSSLPRSESSLRSATSSPPPKSVSLASSPSGLLKGHEVASPSSSSISKVLPASQAALYLQPSGGRIWVMGEVVDLRSEDVRESECDKKCPFLIVQTYYTCCTGYCCCYGCRTSVCDGHISHPDARIRRGLKGILYSSFWISLMFFVTKAIFYTNSKQYDDPALTDTTYACPADIINIKNADCWSGDSYINCKTEDFLPAGTQSITCFQLLTPSLLVYLNAASAAAGLFTLVFGGSTMLFALALSRIRSKERIRLCYLLVAVVTVGWIVTIVAGWATSDLSFTVPLTIICIMFAEIKVRLILYEKAVMEKKAEIERELVEVTVGHQL